MQKYMLITPSVTYALKGRDVLRRLGFSARVERRNSQKSTGCGYGIVTDGDIRRAERALQSSGVKILEIIDY